MKLRPAVAGALLTFAVVGCSSNNSADPAATAADAELSDTNLARELTDKVYGKRLEDAAAGPAEATKKIAASAVAVCDVFHTGVDTGQMSTDPEFESNATWIKYMMMAQEREANLTEKQAYDWIAVSAKYKCAEFSPALRVYYAVHGAK